MKTDIILAGVGGQGILSIAAVIGAAALAAELDLKQAETHGMSQRGGDVVSHLRISDKTIYSDLIPKGKADLILSVEPMESLRYLPFLNESGHIVTNSSPFLNIENYPDITEIEEEIRKHNNVILIDADKLAKEAGSVRASNIVMLGAASPFIDIDFDVLEKGIEAIFKRKGDEIVQMNLKALRIGRKFALVN